MSRKPIVEVVPPYERFHERAERGSRSPLRRFAGWRAMARREFPQLSPEKAYDAMEQRAANGASDRELDRQVSRLQADRRRRELELAEAGVA